MVAGGFFANKLILRDLLLIDVTCDAFIPPTLALELRFLAAGGGVKMGAAIGTRQTVEWLCAGGLRTGNVADDAIITISTRLHGGVFIAGLREECVAIAAGHAIERNRA